MPTPIKIKIGSTEFDAELNDSATAKAVAELLPIRARGNRWGDEIYFRIDVEMDEEPDARAEMDVGELAYWPPGNAFCIFWGPTPASYGGEPRAANPANPLGKIHGDLGVLTEITSGVEVIIQ